MQNITVSVYCWSLYIEALNSEPCEEHQSDHGIFVRLVCKLYTTAASLSLRFGSLVENVKLLLRSQLWRNQLCVIIPAALLRYSSLFILLKTNPKCLTLIVWLVYCICMKQCCIPSGFGLCCLMYSNVLLSACTTCTSLQNTAVTKNKISSPLGKTKKSSLLP